MPTISRSGRTPVRPAPLAHEIADSTPSGSSMILMGWTSDEMARHYGESAAAECAQETQARMGIGENV